MRNAGNPQLQVSKAMGKKTNLKERLCQTNARTASQPGFNMSHL